AKTLPRDEALATLTTRYFGSHGPATIRDFVWWSGLTAADAKRGLEITAARREVADGQTYWSVGPQPRVATEPLAHLLPIYDEYLVAYRDRDAVPHLGSAIGGAGGPRTFRHAIVIGGQVAGTWRTTQDESAIRAELIPLRRLSGRERRALEEAAERYRR